MAVSEMVIDNILGVVRGIHDLSEPMIYDKGKSRTLDEWGFTQPVIRKENKIFLEEKQMKGEVKDIVRLDDGLHSGVITGLDHREKPYDYVDVLIEEHPSKVILKCGFPNKISKESALGLLLERFGATLKVGSSIEYEDFLKKGQKVTFQTITKKTENGTFCNIIRESLSPVE